MKTLASGTLPRIRWADGTGAAFSESYMKLDIINSAFQQAGVDTAIAMLAFVRPFDRLTP